MNLVFSLSGRKDEIPSQLPHLPSQSAANLNPRNTGHPHNTGLPHNNGHPQPHIDGHIPGKLPTRPAGPHQLQGTGQPHPLNGQPLPHGLSHLRRPGVGGVFNGSVGGVVNGSVGGAVNGSVGGVVNGVGVSTTDLTQAQQAMMDEIPFGSPPHRSTQTTQHTTGDNAACS